MAVVKSSKSGQTLFEMIDKTGYLEEEEPSSLQDSQVERHVMDSANTGHPEGEDLGSEVSPHSAVIATLESERANLERAIRQLKGDVSLGGTPQKKNAGVGTTHLDTSSGNSSSSKAQPRELPRGRDRFPTRH